MDPREQALREAVLAGSETAWRALYDEHFDALYAFVWHRAGRNAHRTDEAVQETWLAAVRRIAAFDPARGNFDAWLKGIAANVLKNHRRRWQRDNHSQTLSIDPPAPETEEPSDAGQRMALALTALPLQYQAVLRAKYEERLGVIEISHRWGSTAKAIESMLSRARQALRKAYESLAIEQEGTE